MFVDFIEDQDQAWKVSMLAFVIVFPNFGLKIDDKTLEESYFKTYSCDRQSSIFIILCFSSSGDGRINFIYLHLACLHIAYAAKISKPSGAIRRDAHNVYSTCFDNFANIVYCTVTPFYNNCATNTGHSQDVLNLLCPFQKERPFTLHCFLLFHLE